jgi:AraC family transcriptional regulator
MRHPDTDGKMFDMQKQRKEVAHSSVTIRSGTGSFLLVRRQEIAGLRLAETVYSNEVLEPNHSHHRAYFEIILKGTNVEHDNRSIVEHRALSVAFQPIVESHSSHIQPDGLHSLKIEMNPARLENIGDGPDHGCANGLNAATNFANGPLPWLGLRLYREWQKMDAVSPLVIEGLVLEMIAEAVRCRDLTLGRRPPRWLKAALELLHSEFETPLTLAYVAKAVGVHPVYLARAFRQQRRCTVGEYVRRLRVEYASNEIAGSDTPLGDIALAAGFADQSHFSKVFKREVGLTPADFRNCCSGSSRKTRVHPEP